MPGPVTAISTYQNYGSGGQIIAITATLISFLSGNVPLGTAGSYLLFASLRVDGIGTFTIDTSAVITAYIYSPTFGIVANSSLSANFTAQSSASSGNTYFLITLPVVAYSTVNDNDVLQLYAILNKLPSSGNVEVTQASLLAMKIA